MLEQWKNEWTDLNRLWMAETLGLCTDLGRWDIWEMQYDLNTYWTLLLENSISMCEMLSCIYELVVKATLKMNMQEKTV